MCYVDVLRLVWMLIGSEITYGDALSILYEVRVIVNHADGDKDLLKKSCHEITLPAAKARFAQELRNSPRAMPLLRYPSTRGCPARHLMMPCQSLPDTRHRSRQIRWPAAQSKLRSSAQARSACFVPRAHYKMQINLLFTLTLKPAIKKGAGLYVTRLVVSSGVVIVNDFADRGVVNTQHFLRQIVVCQ